MSFKLTQKIICDLIKKLQDQLDKKDAVELRMSVIGDEVYYIDCILKIMEEAFSDVENKKANIKEWLSAP